MSRFIQESDKPGKKGEVKEPRTLAGQKGYDYSKILEGKKIPTKEGYK